MDCADTGALRQPAPPGRVRFICKLSHRKAHVAAVTIHKLAAVVFGVALAVHVLACVPRVVRSLITDWSADPRQAVPGAGVRAMLAAAAVGGGAALALALFPTIQAYAGR